MHTPLCTTRPYPIARPGPDSSPCPSRVADQRSRVLIAVNGRRSPTTGTTKVVTKVVIELEIGPIPTQKRVSKSGDTALR